MTNTPVKGGYWTLHPAASEASTITGPMWVRLWVRNSSPEAAALWLLSPRLHIAGRHLLPGRGMRVEGAGASVHFEITGSEESGRVGACMRV